MSSRSDPALDDANLRVLPGMMLVEPYKPGKQISVEADIIEMVDRLPASIKAKVIKFGSLSLDPGFSVGDIVVIPPHAGTIIPLGEGIERMVIPVKEAIGVWEE